MAPPPTVCNTGRMDGPHSLWLPRHVVRPPKPNGASDDHEYLRRRMVAAIAHARELQARCRHLREAFRSSASGRQVRGQVDGQP